MSTPRIWDAITSGNLKLLTDILREHRELDFLSSPEATAKVLIDVQAQSKEADYDIPRFCMVCGGRTKEQCTC